MAALTPQATSTTQQEQLQQQVAQNANATAPSVQHFSFLCPGLHDPGSRCEVSKVTYAELFSRSSRFVIPIMQRRYCWEGVLLDRWWRAIYYKDGARDSDNTHRTGICVFRRIPQVPTEGDSPSETPSKELMLVIDGQQRLTTAMLLCASLRDALICWVNSSSRASISPSPPPASLVDACLSAASSLQSDVLLNTKISCEELGSIVSGLRDGDVLDCSRLTPSFPDRTEYYSLLCHRQIVPVAPPKLIMPKHSGLTPNLSITANPSCSVSNGAFLTRARTYFDQQVSQLDGAALLRAVHSTLYDMTAMFNEVLTPNLNLCQVFLWLQERSLLSMGALLFNPAPGIRFEATDLIRNLIFSYYITRNSEEQEAIYRAHWLPLEKLFQTPQQFSYFLEKYLEANLPADSEPSDLEKHVCGAGAFFASKGVTSIDVSGAVLYTKFLRLFNLLVDVNSASADSAVTNSCQVHTSAVSSDSEGSAKRGMSPLSLLDDMVQFARALC
ncbi:hypothetical protein Pelo_11682 [Pelomyxa schiedti]|nr:hypothetical protein Pelo_11682 [Pelomyxa schiedti]